MKKYLTFFSLLITIVSNTHGQSNSIRIYNSIEDALKDSMLVRKLSLRGSNMEKLPIGVLKLTNLEDIDLEANPNLNINEALGLLSRLTHLRKLWISDNKVPDLRNIYKLKSLEELDLDNVEISVLPIELSQLKRLKEVNLDENPNLNMIQVTSVLSKIRSLRVLWLSNNKLSTLPNEILGLKGLEDLWLDDNEFTEIPAPIKRLKIKYLSLFDNKLQSLDLKRGDLPNLTNINLCYNNFKVFPAIELSRIPKLDTVTMWYANIQYVPKEIVDIKNLRVLNLQNNFISQLPVQIAELKHLSVLELAGNNLTEDGIKCVYQQKNLTKLDLDGNRIKNVPTEIGNLNDLTDLSLCENPLSDIPQSISGLQKLQKVQLGYYDAFDWAGAVSILQKLRQLKYVGLFKMKLARMPEGLEKLTSVQEFWMNWNIFDDHEEERIRQMLPKAKFKFE